MERNYVGEWKNGKYHGQGTYIWSDGRKYVGELSRMEFQIVVEHTHGLMEESM